MLDWKYLNGLVKVDFAKSYWIANNVTIKWVIRH